MFTYDGAARRGGHRDSCEGVDDHRHPSRSFKTVTYGHRLITILNRCAASDSFFALDGTLLRDHDPSMPDAPTSPSTLQLLVLERVDETRNMAPYYVVGFEPSLFGDVSLVREWGRFGRLGGRRIGLFADHEAAVEALDDWLARKQKRGYSLRTSSR